MKNIREYLKDLKGPKPPAVKLRWILLAVAAAAGILTLAIALSTGFNRTIDRNQARINRFMSDYDEKKVYKLEKNLLSELARTPRQGRKDRLCLLIGQLQFVKALHNDPQLKEIYLDAAIRYFGKSRLSREVRTSAEALFWLGLCFYQKGDYYHPTAINHLIEALRGGFQDKLKILKILNYIYLKNRDFDVIIGINQEFLKNGYYDGDVVYSLGKAYRELGRPREAEQVLGLVDRLDAERDRHIIRYILFELAETRFQLAEYAAAADAYERCLRSAPDPENDEFVKPAQDRLAVCRERTGAKTETAPDQPVKENRP